jgi:hypothetical protein
MSRAVARVDVQGLYVEDVLLEDGAALPEGCIEERPPEGFHAPKWSGGSGAWEEGKPSSEIVEAVKPQKIAEMHTAAIDELAPLFTRGPGHGKDELIFLLAAHVKRIAGASGAPADPRLSEVERVGSKALAKKAQIEAATTPEELEAVTWEEPV